MTNQMKFKACLLALLPLGIGEMIGGSMFGQILDRFKHKITIYLTMTLLLTAYTVLFTQIYHWKFTSLIYILTFLWGF